MACIGIALSYFILPYMNETMFSVFLSVMVSHFTAHSHFVEGGGRKGGRVSSLKTSMLLNIMVCGGSSQGQGHLYELSSGKWT
jgi:hypothetical protein